MAEARYCGAVLAGGQSRRMGTDKAFVEVEGRWLIARALEALAGASQRLIVGGTNLKLEEAAAGGGARHVADRWPGEGPLGAVVTALGLSQHPVTAVLPCDLVAVEAADVKRLVQAVRMKAGTGEAGQTGAVPVAAVFADERRHHLPLAVETRAVETSERLFASGKRAVAALLDELDVLELSAPASAVADIDSPEDLGTAPS